MKKAIISLLSATVGAAVGAGVVKIMKTDENTKIKNLADNRLALFLLMNQWVKAKQEGKNLAFYFEQNGYKRIAIYGMSFAGQTLISELKGTDIEVVYGIDRNVESVYEGIDIVSMEETLQEVDVVIVTAIYFFDEIQEELSKKIDCPIISLEDIMYKI